MRFQVLELFELGWRRIEKSFADLQVSGLGSTPELLRDSKVQETLHSLSIPAPPDSLHAGLWVVISRTTIIIILLGAALKLSCFHTTY